MLSGTNDDDQGVTRMDMDAGDREENQEEDQHQYLDQNQEEK